VSRPAPLECEKLTLRFGGVKALNDISLFINAGIITAIMGPNGAGKTTLLNCISGTIAGYTGSVKIDGEPLDQLSPRLRTKRGLIRTFQMTRVFGSLTIEENIFLAASAIEHDITLHRINELIALVQLERMRHRQASELSGGQRRLLEIGMCIAQEPRFLLMDEPFAGLNPMMVTIVCDVISAFARTGAGVIVVSHEIPVVRLHANSVVVMAQGTLLATGSPDEVLSDPRVIESYIGGGGASH
jgi:ABC-type branched-subunit amino acid transport system ATPase component